MDENPVQFADAAAWQDAASIARIEEALRESGFEPSTELARVPALGLFGQGWRHETRPFHAVVYESGEHGCWCELHAHNHKADYFIVTSAPRQLEWPSGKKTIETLPGASVPALLESLSALTAEIPLERSDAMLFGLHVHERLHQHWKFTHEMAPDDARRVRDDQQERLKTWLAGVVAYFRPLGFFAAGTGLDDDELAVLVLEYSDSLFRRFPGVEDLCDDFDDLTDFFSLEELARMPDGNQLMDVKLLAILDPERVRWASRVEIYDQAWNEDEVAARCRAERLSAIEYLAPGSNGEDDPFACAYTVLVPTRSRDALARDRGWVL